MYPIQVIAEDPNRAAQASELAASLQQQQQEAPFALVWGEQHLELRKLDEPKLGQFCRFCRRCRCASA